MRKFDPKQHQGDGNNDQKYLSVAGDFLVACVGFSRGQSRNYKPFLKCKFRVIHGPAKDHVFTERIYTNEESYWKLGRWTAAMDYEEEFDLDNDKETREALCYRPFLARVSVRSDPEKPAMKYAQIDMFLQRLEQEQIDVINQWTAEHDAEREALGNSASAGESYPDDADGDPGFTDDDIPF